MLRLTFDKPVGEPLHVLCLGAHSDDIEIGCGGTILRLIGEYPEIEITWVVFSASGTRVNEAEKGAGLFLHGVKNKQVVVKNFRDGYFPYHGAEIKDEFEELKNQTSPDVIFTHFRGDLHQDHRLIEELTWNSFRNHLILEYEIPKYDGGMGSTNYFVRLNEEVAQKKVQYLNETFTTQKSRHWFTEDTFLSLMRIRGIESASDGKYAEGFYAHKLIF